MENNDYVEDTQLESVEEETVEATEAETVEEKEEENRGVQEDEEKEQLKAELAKAKRMLKQKEKKLDKKQDVVESSLSTKDNYALLQANVHLDDVDEVLEFAKYKKISVAEALKTNALKNILRDSADARKTQEATATGNGRRAPKQTSGTVILNDAMRGNLPKTDDDISKLVEARFDSLKNNK